MTQYLRAIYDICEGISLAYLVLVALGLGFFILSVLNFYIISSHKLRFVRRWLGFCLTSLCIYFLLKDYIGLRGGISLYILAILTSIWLEISYAWISAHAYSKRDILPFSSFIECDNAWRPNKTYYKLKQDIEAKGFERQKSFKATNRVSLATLFYSTKEDIALLVLFRLCKSRLETIFYFVSKNEEGKYLVFTNDYTEEILFLKGKYSLHYRTLSWFRGLLKKHQVRMKYSQDNFVDFKKESLDLPHTLYNDNLQKGLERNIYNSKRQEGKLLSQEGKFQFCKKLIINKYFRI